MSRGVPLRGRAVALVKGRWSRLPALRGGLVVAGRRVGGEVDLKRGIVALTVSRPPAAPSPDSGTRVERAERVVPVPPAAPTPLASPAPPPAAAPAARPQRATAEEAAAAVPPRRAGAAIPRPSARRGGRQPQQSSPRSASWRSAPSRPSSWRSRTTATAARSIAGRSRPRRSRASPAPFRRPRSGARRPRRRRRGAQRRNAPPRRTAPRPRLRPHPHRPPRRPATSHDTTTSAQSARVIAWRPRPGAAVYWFELYRQGKLGSRKILEAWPVEPRFPLPRKAPDGSALEPGRYSWSAAPQESRRGRIRYTGLTRAGRFVLTADGQIVPRR